MRNLYGIVHTEDGRYVMASMRCDESGKVASSGIRRWQSNNFLMPYLLFHRGVCFGIASWWRPRTSNVPLDNMVYADSDAYDDNRRFDIVAHAADLRIHTQALKSNLLAVVPEDTFLVSLPLNLYKEDVNSFISISCTSNYYLAGIIIDKQLIASFKMAPCSEDKLPAHIGRIRRYLNINFPNITFPETVFVIGNSSNTPDSAFAKPPIHISEEEGDINVLRAMGAAFAQNVESVPLFASQTEESIYREKRTLIFGISAGLIVIPVLLVAFFIGINFWSSKRIDSFKADYQHVISHNKDVKKIIDRNNELAETILRLEDTFTRKTIWGKFFHAIARNKPDNLYFARLGSEPVKDKENIIRIALTGWTPKESSVTNFISILQELPYITQITLSSMERDKKKTSVYSFKILCTLLLNEQ